VSEERAPVSPEVEAPEYPATPELYTISPEVQARAAELSALLRSQIDELAAAREAGRLDGDAAGYLRGIETAAKIANDFSFPQIVRLHAGEMTAQEMRTARAIAAAIEATIRAKLEGK
jgi:hypothetical protein